MTSVLRFDRVSEKFPDITNIEMIPYCVHKVSINRHRVRQCLSSGMAADVQLRSLRDGLLTPDESMPPE